jgi:hypothetical protein
MAVNSALNAGSVGSRIAGPLCLLLVSPDAELIAVHAKIRQELIYIKIEFYLSSN